MDYLSITCILYISMYVAHEPLIEIFGMMVKPMYICFYSWKPMGQALKVWYLWIKLPVRMKEFGLLPKILESIKGLKVLRPVGFCYHTWMRIMLSLSKDLNEGI